MKMKLTKLQEEKGEKNFFNLRKLCEMRRKKNTLKRREIIPLSCF